MTAERRRHERVKATHIVHFRRGPLSGAEQTVTIDISAGGLCFFSEKHISLGKVIKLKMFNDKKSSDRVMKGRIVWSREYNDSLSKGYLYGISFLNC